MPAAKKAAAKPAAKKPAPAKKAPAKKAPAKKVAKKAASPVKKSTARMRRTTFSSDYFVDAERLLFSSYSFA